MTYRALLIGNSIFDADGSLNPLNAPTKDVARLHRSLVDTATGLFSDEHVRLVVERTSEDLLDEIDLFFAAAHRDDLLLLYYSGHGLLDDRNQLFLCGRNTRSDRLLRTAVSNVRINEFIDQSVARCTVIILDCCSSGMFKGGDVAVPLAGPGRYVVSSTRGSALANDAAVPTGTSLFTEHLVTGLLGGAEDRDGDGYLDLREIYDYVRTRLTANTKQVPHSRFDGDAAVVLARRPELRREPEPVPPGRAGDPAFVLSENEINLNDVHPRERLKPEIVEIYRLGEVALDCTATTEETWLRAEVRGQQVVVELHPLTGHNRAKIRVVDRTTRTAQVLRVHVFLHAPTSSPPPGTNDPPYAAGPVRSASETRVTARMKGGPAEPPRVVARASVKVPPAVPPIGDPPARWETGRGGFRGWRRTAAFAVAGMLLTVAGTAYGLSGGSGDAAVPMLVGLTSADAEERLRKAGLNASLVPATAVPCTVGQVVGQSPAADEPTRLGTVVVIEVCGDVASSDPASPSVVPRSTGPATPSPTRSSKVSPETSPLLVVPDLGDTEDSAGSALESAGLRAVFKSISGSAAKGQVTDSQPKTGEEVEPDSEVTVFLSLGDLVEVPNVSGIRSTVDSATAILEKAGLRVQIKCIDGTDLNRVARQSPNGGSEVEKGSVVTLMVTNGPRIGANACLGGGKGPVNAPL
ncbi:caspase, EACC1-associated type [Actinoplanes subglobosus]|uniref:PASTA domain-containing protein n=1 Tax=Actinoplanes subglobosus TaxID=1547892 RepID=A0ABV8J6M8_9ACTN